jgi:hypothetical protein
MIIRYLRLVILAATAASALFLGREEASSSRNYKAEDVRRVQAGGEESESGVLIGLQGASGEETVAGDGTSIAAIAAAVGLTAVVALLVVAAGVYLFYSFCTESRGKSVLTIETYSNSTRSHSQPAAVHSGSYSDQQPRNGGPTPNFV